MKFIEWMYWEFWTFQYNRISVPQEAPLQEAVTYANDAHVNMY